MAKFGDGIKKAVILAGGINSRMMPWSKIIPKALLPVGKKLAIQYLIEECLLCGLSEIYIVVNSKDTSIKKFFTPDPILNNFLEKQGKKEALAKLAKIESLSKYLKFINQPEPLGETNAFLCAKKFIKNEPVAVLLGDIIYCNSTIPALKQIMREEIKDKLLILDDGRIILTPIAMSLLEKRYQVQKDKVDSKIVDLFKQKEINFFTINAVRIELGLFEKYDGMCTKDIPIIIGQSRS